MTPDRRVHDPMVNAAQAVTTTIVPTLKLVSKYGLSTVIAVVLLFWMLFRFEQKIDATNLMLEKHVQTTTIGAYLAHQTCLQLTKLSGDLPQACDVPTELTK